LKIFKEIKAVGFKDWLWFVFILKRNEFSSKLKINVSRIIENPILIDVELKKVAKLRNKAHKIDLKLGDLK
jgi:hypothetical protein